ncbi:MULTISPECIES: benzoate/H(+) symporter BenE family transporter [unclassified Idiomarina]|jgi:benzoate membrane transport protein|uniref:benzoate/H(+) symporter BenE family transporter n=1 Tax=unclassified Idiomarina TaxID=2614829 RepID=UPI00257A4A39|nr:MULTISPECIES: benzoate/H(+) symporter BenE family transporter [unclassified Idiomarina]|tara:strand:- start:2854 stop:4014 length:1161 start_codon:yes stop_codon:yes gene_type:complete
MRFSISHIMAGATAVFVGYSSAVVLILEAVKSLNGSVALQSSWLLALGLAMGLSSIILSWRYKAPILTAWSTPGVALLIIALAGVSVAEAVGIFIFSSGLILLSGLSGISDRLLKYIPVEIAAAILAGILLKFVLALVPAFDNQPLITATLVIVYFVMRKLTPKLVFFWVLLAAVGLPVLTKQFDTNQLILSAPDWVWVWPDFNFSLLVGVGIPLYVVTMVSQNLPGIMMLRSNGYAVPLSPLLRVTGLFGVIMAPLGVFAINLAAITAAICQTSDADTDRNQRYKAAMAAGVFYIIAGLAGSIIVGLFLALPTEATSALAGLALLPVLAVNFRQAFSHEKTLLASVMAFIVTASGVNFLGINSSFWGLLIGLVGYYFLSNISGEK